MNSKMFLTIDLGATSGRAVLMNYSDGRIYQEEIHRFPNKIEKISGKNYWNIYGLYNEIEKILEIISRQSIKISSIGIDTWGVDFVYVDENGDFLNLPRAYRDPYTNDIPEKFFQQLPRDEVYRLTGIQIMNFNSLYQLYAARKENFIPLNVAKTILFIPDALSYLLTGKQICEYTIASTSQFLNARTRNIEQKLLDIVNVNADKFPEIVEPGTVIGTLRGDLQDRFSLGAIPVVAVAGHDTASAVAAIPAQGRNFAYLSSGTWSLMGIEVEQPIITEESSRLNFTNEGGVCGTIRFLKNITGMWILEQYQNDLKKDGISYTYPQIVEMAQSSEALGFNIDPDHSSFAAPASMKVAIDEYCINKGWQIPQSHGAYFLLIFSSLAAKYKIVLDQLSSLSPHPIECLHIIGGGAKNDYLNQLTADATGLKVVAGPSECTALGNALMQAKALGVFSELDEMRQVILASVETKIFNPNKK